MMYNLLLNNNLYPQHFKDFSRRAAGKKLSSFGLSRGEIVNILSKNLDYRGCSLSLTPAVWEQFVGQVSWCRKIFLRKNFCWTGITAGRGKVSEQWR